jgi:hypothetical protein
VLLEGVEAFELSYHGASGAPLGTWPPVGPVDALPRAVEVTLEVKGVGSFKRLFLVGR